MKNYPRPPAHIQRFVDIIGPDAAFDLLMSFGGSEVFFAKRVLRQSKLRDVLGASNVQALYDVIGEGKINIPTGKEWLVRVMHERGMSANEIAPILHTKSATVRRLLKQSLTREGQDAYQSVQLSLPL